MSDVIPGFESITVVSNQIVMSKDILAQMSGYDEYLKGELALAIGSWLLKKDLINVTETEIEVLPGEESIKFKEEIYVIKDIEEFKKELNALYQKGIERGLRGD